MQTFNLHTHTWRCGHADGTDCQYIEKAIEAGFTCLGFSEHIQYKEDNGKYGRINFEEYPLYFSDLKELKEKYKGQITILSGLEAAYVPEVMDELTELSKYCDFILLGQHQGGLTEKKYCLKCNDDDVLQYATDIENALKTGLYTIIAHPDFFMSSRDTWSKQCHIAAQRICNAAMKHNIPLELNIKGVFEPKAYIDNEYCTRYPYKKFWEIASSVGNQVIYGWDAHTPNDLLRTTAAIAEIIVGLKLNFICSINQITFLDHG